MIPGKRYTPADIVRIARQRLWLVTASTLVVGLATVVGGRFLQDRYRAETLILVVPQRVPESYVKSTVTSRIEDRLPSISQQILSRTRLEQIIQDFNLYPAERQTSIMEDIVTRMRRDIDVDVVKGDAFRVGYTGAEPKTVMQVTQRLASLFIDENLRDREVMAEDSYRFIDSQLSEARLRLVEHEKKLEEYRRKYSGQLPSQLDSNLRVIQNAQLQLQTLSEAKARSMDRRLIVERGIADLNAPSQASIAPAVVSPSGDSVTGTAQQQLEIAQDALRQMELRLTPEHPDVVRTRRLIATLEEQAEAERLRVPLPSGAAVPQITAFDIARQNRLKEAQAELENITRQEQRRDAEEVRVRQDITTYQARVEASPTRESELVELTRDYDTLQKTYVSLLFKQQDSKLAANLERRQIGEHFNVLDPAQLPERPISPNRARLDLMGIALGFALGIGLAVLLELGDSTLKSDDDVVAALDLRVLALVPMLGSEPKRRNWRGQSIAAASVALMSIAAVLFTLWKLRA